MFCFGPKIFIGPQKIFDQIIIHSLGGTEDTGVNESSASLEQILTVNEYVDCDRYEDSDKTAGYQADALRFSKDLINLFKKYSWLSAVIIFIIYY